MVKTPGADNPSKSCARGAPGRRAVHSLQLSQLWGRAVSEGSPDLCRGHAKRRKASQDQRPVTWKCLLCVFSPCFLLSILFLRVRPSKPAYALDPRTEET